MTLFYKVFISIFCPKFILPLEFILLVWLVIKMAQSQPDEFLCSAYNSSYLTLTDLRKAASFIFASIYQLKIRIDHDQESVRNFDCPQSVLSQLNKFCGDWDRILKSTDSSDKIVQW